MNEMKQELIGLLCKFSVNISTTPDRFKLVSGRKSNFYADCRTTATHPRGALLIGSLMLDAIGDSKISGVGGLESGAIPLATATSIVSEMRKQGINAFWVKKELKDHGIVRMVEGNVKAGDEVAIIDDVATTGGSTIKAIERAREAGLVVTKVVILVDRQEGGMEKIRQYVPDAVAIITRQELHEEWIFRGYSEKD